MSKAVYEIASSGCWAILPERLQSMLATKEMSAPQAAAKRGRQQQKSIAIIPVVGVIDQRDSWVLSFFGGTSTEWIAAQIDAAVADSSIGGIVLDVDSPGGSVYGVQELSDRIYRARTSKPIYASVNGMMASAAVWIGTAAERVFVSPSSEAGSVGVVYVHEDTSAADEQAGVKYTILTAGKYKWEDAGGQPLNDDAKAHIQGRIDSYYAQFLADVRRNRRDRPNVGHAEKFGDGRMFGAKESIANGLADRVATMDEVLGMMAGKIQSNQARANAIATAEAKYRG